MIDSAGTTCVTGYMFLGHKQYVAFPHWERVQKSDGMLRLQQLVGRDLAPNDLRRERIQRHISPDLG